MHLAAPPTRSIRSLAQWIYHTLGRTDWSVKTRQRGNTLQILFEGNPCPSQAQILEPLITACLEADFLSYLPAHHAPVYRLMLYGRNTNAAQPHWQVPLHLNQLDRHLALVQQAKNPDPEQSHPESPHPAESRLESPYPEQSRPDSPHPIESRLESLHSERSRPESPHPIESRLESLHSQQSRPESPYPAELDSASLHSELAPDLVIQDDGVSSTSPIALVSSDLVSGDLAGDSSNALPVLSIHEGDALDRAESLLEIQNPAIEKNGKPLTPRWETPLDTLPVPDLRTPDPGSTNLDSPDSGIPLIISNRSLASQGDPEAIAHYLSETFSSLGIAVQVQGKTLAKGNGLSPHLSLGQVQRLTITCESPYSLDAAILADPLSQRLRDLDLRGFRDAIVLSRVQGETEVDWVLRVDLTPPEEMLRDLARWGDIPALTALIDRHLINQTVKTEVELKDKTLHLFCKCQTSPPVSPHQPSVMDSLRPLLQSLAPQGIHAAMVYGLRPHLTPALEQAAPLWVDWLSLPAAQHPDLAPSTQELAETGDLTAVTFVIDRLLNPDLTSQLATGGIRVYLRRKADLLHVMCDAPTCPRQAQVGMRVVQLLRQLRLPRIAGVRVYGRQSGQKDPLWCQGVDFIPRKRDVPEATPEFAASAQHLGDLLSASNDSLSLGLDPDSEEEESLVSLTAAIEEALEGCRRLLISSQLFSPLEQDPSQGIAVSWGQSFKTIVTWGALGLLSTLMADWFLGSALRTLEQPEVVLDPGLAPEQIEARLAALDAEDPLADTPADFGITTPERSAPEFTELEPNSLPFVAATQTLPPQALGHHFQINADYPNFNNELFDQKRQLLQKTLVEKGVPDVLIVGSSRALRGVDPLVLQHQLQRLGYPELNILNLAVNGATAQVVGWQLQRMLPPDYMPQLIIWADGARAFNSGRPDVTYNAIRIAPAYGEVEQGNHPPLLTPIAPVESIAPVDIPPPPIAQTWDLLPPDQWNTLLVDSVGVASAVYNERDRLKEWLVVTAASYLPSTAAAILAGRETTDPLTVDPLDPEFSGIADAPEGEGRLDDQGFVALSTRFNPATYYQKYARVSGDYDRDYENFRFQGEQQDALEALLNFTQSQGIPVVFVNLPLSAEYLDPIRLDYEQQFQSELYQLQADGQLLLRNLVDLWPWAVENFSDPSHLNRYGAEVISIHLAEDPLIPWPSQSNADRAQSSQTIAEDP